MSPVESVVPMPMGKLQTAMPEVRLQAPMALRLMAESAGVTWLESLISATTPEWFPGVF